MKDDLISRSALRKAFRKRVYYFNKLSWDEANSIIDNAPTVEERPKGEKQTIFVVTVRDEIDGEDVEYRRYFSSEEKAETFVHDNLKGQIVMSLSEEEVEE